MAQIRPLHGLRFSDAAGDATQLVAPPYDVISPEEREELAAQSPYNVVRLTLPEQEKDDRSKFVKYARSAARLEEWRRSGQIIRDEQPTLYRYTQTFTIPGTAISHTRTTLIALIKVEPYDKGVVLPHEQTFPKHKEDRLRILEATRTHLESIFGLYEDTEGSIHATVTSAPATPVIEITTPEDSIHHVFELIQDPHALGAITGALEPKTVWIADGHHRYETALTFREMAGQKPGLVAEDFMMMGLCSIGDPGLVLLPTHRILKKMPLTPDEFQSRMAEHFTLTPTPNPDLMSRIATAGPGTFGIALPGGNGLIATAKDHAALAALVPGEASLRLKGLDVTLLHNIIFERVLGLTGLDFFGYTRIEQEALDAVENGSPASFLMNPPTIEDMRVLAIGGEKMPQKSTYYYPKLLSGLVMYALKDFSE